MMTCATTAEPKKKTTLLGPELCESNTSPHVGTSSPKPDIFISPLSKTDSKILDCCEVHHSRFALTFSCEGYNLDQGEKKGQRTN